MKKAVTIILLILMMNMAMNVKLNAGIPVVDLSALAQRISLLAQEIAKWKIYIDKFKDYLKNFQKLKNTFEHSIKGFKPDELRDYIGENFEKFVKDIISGIAYDDESHLDDWSVIFKDVDELEVRYKNINDTKYLDNNPLVKNPKVREMVDARKRLNEEDLLNIKKQAETLQLIRESEREILEKFGHYEDLIDKVGTSTQETADNFQSYTRIAAVTDLIDLDILKLGTNQLTLYRLLLESELKTMTRELLITQQIIKDAQQEIDNYKALAGEGK